MALIKCGECGDVISNKADKCPKCGAPGKNKRSLTGIMMKVIKYIVGTVIIIVSRIVFYSTYTLDGARSEEETIDIFFSIVGVEPPEKGAIYADDLPKGAEKLEIDCKYGAKLMGETPEETNKLYKACIQEARM